MLVTVYLPTRNRKASLAKAVDSVLRQTYKTIELIVVNDASTDDTADFLKQKSLADPRLIHFNNATVRGAPASRNLGIMQARGEFVTGLDDDDEFMPERIGTFVDYWKILTENGVRPACLFAQEKWMRNGELYSLSQRRGSITADDLFHSNFLGNQIFAPRFHYMEAGLFDERLPAWQDLDLFIRILIRFGRGHLLDIPTYLYDCSSGFNRISNRPESIRAAADILIDKYASISPRKAQELFLQVFGDLYKDKPNVRDWIRFCKWGFWPRGILRLMRATLS